MTEPLRMDVEVWELLDMPGVVNIGASWGSNGFSAVVHDRDPRVSGHHPELTRGLRETLGGVRWSKVRLDIWEDEGSGEILIKLPGDGEFATSVNERKGDPRYHLYLARMLRRAVHDARAKEERGRAAG